MADEDLNELAHRVLQEATDDDPGCTYPPGSKAQKCGRKPTTWLDWQWKERPGRRPEDDSGPGPEVMFPSYYCEDHAREIRERFE